jgi:signal transduction histidine kinase
LSGRTLLIRVIAIVAFAETLVMFAIPLIPPFSGIVLIIIDTAALIVIVTPLIYFFVVRPHSHELTRQFAEQHKNEGLLRQTLEAFSDSIILFDRDEKVVFSNEKYHQTFPTSPPKEKIIGATQEDLLRYSAGAGLIKSPLAKSDIEAWIKSRLEDRRNMQEDVRETRLSTGQTFLSRHKQTDDGSIMVIHTDISERKRAEEESIIARQEAEQANKSKTEFLANMSHELRTPLNSIIGFSDILCTETFGPVGHDKNKEYVEHINSSGKHLHRLIGDILDLSKIEAGEEELIEEEINIREVINECLQMASSRSFSKKITFPVVVQEGLTSLFADRLKVLQILLNLLSNAVKFTPDGGEIKIEAAVDTQNRTLIKVRDTGEGISPEDLQKVLEPFGQAGNALTRKHDGTGLGLALVKSITEMHGGEIKLESEVGLGTTATIVFPMERTLYKSVIVGAPRNNAP